MPKINAQYEESQQKKIMGGAARIFAARGYNPTTLDQICQELKLSKGAIYVYFKNKEDLFVSVLRSIYDQRFVSLSRAFEEDDPITQKFEKILNRLGGLVDEEDFVFMRLWLQGFLECEHIPALIAIKTKSRQNFKTLISDLLKQGQEQGEINPDLNISSLSDGLMAISDGLMLHSLVQGWGMDAARVRSVISDTFTPLLSQQNHSASNQ